MFVGTQAQKRNYFRAPILSAKPRLFSWIRRLVRCRQLAQLMMAQRKRFVGGLGGAVLNGLKNAGKISQY